VTNADDSSATLPSAFRVQAATPAQINAYISARPEIGIGRAATYRVTVNNTGNTDAFAVPVNLFFPSYLTFQLQNGLTQPTQLPGQTAIDYDQVPITVAAGDETLAPLIVPFVPAGSEREIVFTLQTPSDQGFIDAHLDATFSVRVTVGRPVLALGAPSGTTSARAAFGPRAATVPPFIQDLFTTPEGRNCLSALLNVATNALGVVPFAECVKDLGADFANVFTGAVGNVTSDSSAGNNVASAVQMELSVLQLVLDCSGVDVAIVQVIAAINTGISIAIAADNCNIFLKREAKTKIVAAIDPNAKTGTGRCRPGARRPARHAAAVSGRVRKPGDRERTGTGGRRHRSARPLRRRRDHAEPRAVRFGDRNVPVPPGTEFDVQVDLRPESPLLVNISGSLDVETGVLTWRFQSIDPATGFPPEAPVLGFSTAERGAARRAGLRLVHGAGQRGPRDRHRDRQLREHRVRPQCANRHGDLVERGRRDETREPGRPRWRSILLEQPRGRVVGCRRERGRRRFLDLRLGERRRLHAVADEHRIDVRHLPGRSRQDLRLLQRGPRRRRQRRGCAGRRRRGLHRGLRLQRSRRHEGGRAEGRHLESQDADACEVVEGACPEPQSASGRDHGRCHAREARHDRTAVGRSVRCPDRCVPSTEAEEGSVHYVEVEEVDEAGVRRDLCLRK
jgi:uncharacterized repeat protein (TIGR01451 family)